MIIFKLDINLIPSCSDYEDVNYFKARYVLHNIGKYLAKIHNGVLYYSDIVQDYDDILKLDISDAHARVIEKEYPFIKAIDTIYFKSELSIKMH